MRKRTQPHKPICFEPLPGNGLGVSSAESFSDIPAYVLSRLNLTAGEFYSSDNATDYCPDSRFGMTCERLMEGRGEVALMSCAVDSPAKISAQRAREQASMGPGRAYGEKCGESLGKYDHDTASWKTRQHSLLEGLDAFSETWPRWGTMQSGEFWPLPMPYGLTELRASITSESVCGSRAPTPTVCGNYNRKGASKTSGDGLATFVKRYPTPMSSDARKWSHQSMEERISKGQMVRLTTAVSPQGGAGGSLKPQWVEWLMGFPIGWTALQPLETHKFQQWLHSHGKPSQAELNEVGV